MIYAAELQTIHIMIHSSYYKLHYVHHYEYACKLRLCSLTVKITKENKFIEKNLGNKG